MTTYTGFGPSNEYRAGLFRNYIYAKHAAIRAYALFEDARIDWGHVERAAIRVWAAKSAWYAAHGADTPLTVQPRDWIRSVQANVKVIT